MCMCKYKLRYWQGAEILDESVTSLWYQEILHEIYMNVWTFSGQPDPALAEAGVEGRAHPSTPAPPIHSDLVCGVSFANMNYEQVQDM